MERFEEALADLNMALEAWPEDAACYHARGTVLARLGRLAGAQMDLDHALRLRPDDITALKARAEVCARRGDLYGAEADYTRVSSWRRRTPAGAAAPCPTWQCSQRAG